MKIVTVRCSGRKQSYTGLTKPTPAQPWENPGMLKRDVYSGRVLPGERRFLGGEELIEQMIHLE